MLKKAFLFLFLIVFFVSYSNAHSGRTDSSGGHYNRKTGEYHYHNSGYTKPAPEYNTKPYSTPRSSPSTNNHNSDKELSDSQIKALMIKESISSYSGNCPCPYNTDRAGRRCGKRSAWSKAGGYSPLCYDSDISDEMVKRYKMNN